MNLTQTATPFEEETKDWKNECKKLNLVCKEIKANFEETVKQLNKFKKLGSYGELRVLQKANTNLGNHNSILTNTLRNFQELGTVEDIKNNLEDLSYRTRLLNNYIEQNKQLSTEIVELKQELENNLNFKKRVAIAKQLIEIAKELI